MLLKKNYYYLVFPGEQLQQVINTQKPLFTVSVYSRYSGHIHEAQGKEMSGSIVAAPAMNENTSITTQELSLKEGMYLQKGQTVFKVYNPNKVWALLNIYPSDQSFIKVGNKVKIVPEARPDKDFNSSIYFIEPFFRPGSKTLTARVNIDNSVLQLPIGSQVKATIFSNPVNAEWLPKEAVLSLVALERRKTGPQVFLHREQRENLASLRHIGNAAPHALDRGKLCDIGAVELNRAGAHRVLTDQRAQQAGLADAVAAQHGHLSPFRLAKCRWRLCQPYADRCYWLPA